MMRVLVCGLSMPLSMMVVATSTSSSPRAEVLHHALELLLGHLAVRHAHARLAGGRASRGRTASSMVRTRLDT